MEERCSYLSLVVNPFSDFKFMPLVTQIHLSDKWFSRSIGDRRKLTKLELSLSHLSIGVVRLPIFLLVTTAIVLFLGIRGSILSAEIDYLVSR